MADHDDQISNNRRRLFKALSTAPVVMTLRPGEGLASSAYQCAEKIVKLDTEPTLFSYGPSPAPTEGFKVKALDYYPTAGALETCVLSGNTFLVFIDRALYGDANPGVAIEAGFRLAGQSRNLQLLDKDGNDCGDAIKPIIDGQFALLYDISNPTIGVPYPKANPELLTTEGDPVVQGLTGTCWDSLVGLPVNNRISNG